MEREVRSYGETVGGSVGSVGTGVAIANRSRGRKTRWHGGEVCCGFHVVISWM